MSLVKVLKNFPRAIALLGIFLSPIRQVQAQGIGGVVVREGAGTPVTGAVVLLLGVSGDSTLSRGTTSSTGRFQFMAPAPGAYRIRVLRLGQRPFTTAIVRVGAGGTNEQIVLPEQPIQLARVDVKGSGGCQRSPAPASVVGQLLSEVRTAFLASVSVSPDGEPRATYRKFRRSEGTSVDVIPSNEVYAMEVYVGRSRIPQKLGGFRDEFECGLVAVWTRVGSRHPEGDLGQ